MRPRRSIAFGRRSAFSPAWRRDLQASTDLLFVVTARDIVGLYLDPPDRALVRCVDEKSQAEAIA
jgi:hypothetical protein